MKNFENYFPHNNPAYVLHKYKAFQGTYKIRKLTGGVKKFKSKKEKTNSH